MKSESIRNLIHRIPDGYSVGFYFGVKYSISKKTYNAGRSYKIYAEELGGNDFISLNYYQSASGDHLKPCEMPTEKVIVFLTDVEISPAD
ncbi:hypothetical protein NT6N_12910 [Oceaniferula spumae]|uniref:Peptide methionine sulfoxide reductase n=1 Tax=Oceaniferula spumae TaxID=2979115 RepID=A0AAT9FJX6_9BACT